MAVYRMCQRLCAVVCVAGLSRRMGAFKPLLPLGGTTVVEAAVASALAGGASSAVCVTGYRGDEVAARLRASFGDRVTVAENPRYATSDMLASVKTGLRALPPCDGFFLLPGDMPLVSPGTFRSVAAAWVRAGGRGVAFPTLDGFRKHPPLVDAALVGPILAYGGGGGLRGFWRVSGAPVREVPVDDVGVWVDLDTQQDYLSCIETLGKQWEDEEVETWTRSAARW